MSVWEGTPLTLLLTGYFRKVSAEMVTGACISFTFSNFSFCFLMYKIGNFIISNFIEILTNNIFAVVVQCDNLLRVYTVK